jgi:ribosomal protein S18 acetylase RimI-like enzyme
VGVGPVQHLLASQVALRPAAPADRDFLLRVYASTREEELAMTSWDEGQKRAFLEAQFAAQDAWYRERYPGAALDVILADGVPAGRFYVHRREREIRLMDIALLPAYRGRGIGSSLLNGLFAEAAAAGKTVTIHVEAYNPARRLYERLGFTQIGEHGIYHLMEWRPPGDEAGAALSPPSAKA